MSAGMVLPPVDQHGVVQVGADAFDDRRVPRPVGSWLDPSEVRPLGYYHGPDDSPCRPPAQPGEDRMTRWALARHLFDVLVTHGQQRYTEDMEPTPVEVRLVMTCVRCGVVMGVHGQATSDEDGGIRSVAQLDPVPLQAGELLAQQTRADSGWRHEVDSTWAIYRDGARVGSMSHARGARGRRYVAGRLGDDGPVAEGPTALAVLRRLARQTSSVATA